MLFESAVLIAICDAGLGNLRSVERAVLEAAKPRASVSVVVSPEPDVIARADKIVVPGQGGFGACSRALFDRGLAGALLESIARGTPYLGICLGLQVLFGASEESPGAPGLGVLDGDVVRLDASIDETTGAPRKIPHVGWNVAAPVDGHGGVLDAATRHFYFVHSYVVRPTDARIVAATTDYGASFVSAIAKDNVFACQFHPEKSQRAGIALLERFVSA
jgi:glutamine amidotransferase